MITGLVNKRGKAYRQKSTMLESVVWSRFSWPEELISEMTDKKGKVFGCKSTMLECIGLLIPFIAYPEKIKGRHLQFTIDNTAVKYGWYSGRVKKDSTATEILRCANYMAAYIGATIHVSHVGRVSNSMAKLADELSRIDETENESMKSFLTEDKFKEVKGYLQIWLEDPMKRKSLFRLMIDELKNKLT